MLLILSSWMTTLPQLSKLACGVETFMTIFANSCNSKSRFHWSHCSPHSSDQLSSRTLLSRPSNYSGSILSSIHLLLLLLQLSPPQWRYSKDLPKVEMSISSQGKCLSKLFQWLSIFSLSCMLYALLENNSTLNPMFNSDLTDLITLMFIQEGVMTGMGALSLFNLKRCTELQDNYLMYSIFSLLCQSSILWM